MKVDDRVILLVEDSPDDAELTLEALRSSRLTNEIVVTRNGAEAVDYLFGRGQYEGRDTSVRPGLILLDLKLPKIDGHEVVRLIRADDRTSVIPVVIMTSSREEVDLVQGYKLGANSYVRKPVDFVQFSEIVQQLANYWLLLNEGVGCSENRREGV